MNKSIKITEPSYVALLTTLKVDLETDVYMIDKDKNKAQKLVDELFELLWKYSA